MSDHSNGSMSDDGSLKVSDRERHRLTGGLTISLGKKHCRRMCVLIMSNIFTPKV